MKTSFKRIFFSTFSDTSDSDEEMYDYETRGFNRGLEAKKIIGATVLYDEYQFLINWHGCEETDLVNAQEANLKCPQAVIQFYQERAGWIYVSSDEED